MHELTEEQWRLDPSSAHTHVGDLAWGRFQHTGREPEWPTRLWEDGGQIVAYGWIRPPLGLDHEVHPEHRELRDDVLDWFEAVAEGETLVTSALSTDVETLAALERRGYGPNAEATPLACHARSLEGALLEPTVPVGFRLRTVEPADLDRRVVVHRAAFHPSRVTAESYANVIAAWPYRAELDCVVEAPDGSFAAFCLVWLDEANGVGELEPVGTHPDFRRLGLATAVCRFALRALQRAGATRAVVYAYDDPAGNPGPKRLYESIGFREYARSIGLVKTR
jgi:ribosomal protein S18 acetylase RimI-like enzyme